MIKLNELLDFLAANGLRVRTKVSNHLTADIEADLNDIEQVDDLVELYGEHELFSAEPVAAGVMRVDLVPPVKAV